MCRKASHVWTSEAFFRNCVSRAGRSGLLGCAPKTLSNNLDGVVFGSVEAGARYATQCVETRGDIVIAYRPSTDRPTALSKILAPIKSKAILALRRLHDSRRWQDRH